MYWFGANRYRTRACIQQTDQNRRQRQRPYLITKHTICHRSSKMTLQQCSILVKDIQRSPSIGLGIHFRANGHECDQGMEEFHAFPAEKKFVRFWNSEHVTVVLWESAGRSIGTFTLVLLIFITVWYFNPSSYWTSKGFCHKYVKYVREVTYLR